MRQVFLMIRHFVYFEVIKRMNRWDNDIFCVQTKRLGNWSDTHRSCVYTIRVPDAVGSPAQPTCLATGSIGVGGMPCAHRPVVRAVRIGVAHAVEDAQKSFLIKT